MKQANELVRICMSRGWKNLPKVSVSEWAQKHMVLPQDAAEPGRYKGNRAPFQVPVMDAFTQPGIHSVAAMMAAQMGKSTIMNCVMGRFAHLDPAPIMMVQPTIDMAQDYSKTRISPMIRGCRVLAELFHDEDASGQRRAKTRDGNDTILSKIFPGGRLILGGANSPAGLASRPIRILLCDEVDRFPDSAGTEGDPVDLASKRTSTYWNYVIGLFSTPTMEGHSRIETEYLAGTQEVWQHRCPNCGEWHTIDYRQMECSKEKPRIENGKRIVVVLDVKWRCPDCGFSFSEAEMQSAEQKYTAMNPDAERNGIRSFHVNGFASPWVGWKKIMREWLEAKGDPARERVVVNTRFGETYAEPGAFEDADVFLRRREKYGAELPDGVLLLTAAVDTQDNRLEYEICGWGMGEESWGIQKGVVLGAPNNPAVWAELDVILDKTYVFADGSGLKVWRTFIDHGGHYSTQVYEYCTARFHRQRIAIQGKGGPGIPLVYKVSRPHRGGIPLQMLGVDGGKQEVMDCLSVSEPGPRYFHFPLDEPELGLDFRGYDEIYFKGIISEHKRTVKKNGILRQIWEPTQGVRNEPLDLRVYNLACMKSGHIDWERLQEAVKGLPQKELPRHRRPEKQQTHRQKSRQMNVWR